MVLSVATRPLVPTPSISAYELVHPSLARAPFTHADWTFETKLDGFRALARKVGRNVDLLSRQGRSLADAFPEVMAARPDCAATCAKAPFTPRR